MNRSVTFRKLWLVSQRDAKARQQSFSRKTLLLGPNGTGKSRITKHLMWVLGCAPRKKDAGSWDPDTVAGLEFSYGGVEYLALRQGKNLGLFVAGAEGDKLLFAANNMGTWARLFAPVFGFSLQLKRPASSSFSQAGLDYMTLPFYMDQDGSWGPEWATYENLSQFTDWRKPTFEAFLGLRPNAYFDHKLKKDEVHARLLDKTKELEAQRTAFNRVRDVLPKNLPSINIGAFRDELADLGKKATHLQQQQTAVRAKLVAVVNTREKLQAELNVASAAHRELTGDLSFLSESPGGSIECPTCGTVHLKTFHAQLQLSNDSDAMSHLLSELRQQVEGTRLREVAVRSELKEIERAAAALEAHSREKKVRLRLEDVLASHSKKTLDSAFQRVTAELGAAAKRLEDEETVLDVTLRLFEDKAKKQEVGKYYASQVSSLSALLNVPPDEQIDSPRPGARAHSGGSSAPRSVLAVHLAMLNTNAEYGDTPLFPFVVDTLQQSGQDEVNLRRMIEVLVRAASVKHQVILAVEKLPDGLDTSEFDVVELATKGAVLTSENYANAVARLQSPLALMREASAATAQTT